MKKITKPNASFGLKLFKSLLLLWLLIGFDVQAWANCTRQSGGSGQFCLTYVNGWQNNSGHDRKAIADINVNALGNYKESKLADGRTIYTSQTLIASTPMISVAVVDNRNLPHNNRWLLQVSPQFIPTRGGFRHVSIPNATFFIKLQGGNQGEIALTARETSYAMQLPQRGAVTGGTVDYALRFSVYVVWDKIPNDNEISLPSEPLTFFSVKAGGKVEIAQAVLRGRTINPPRAKTCTAIPSSTARTFPLKHIDIAQISGANQESTGTYNHTEVLWLENCTAGTTIKLWMSDPRNASNNNDWLPNIAHDNPARNAGVRLYRKQMNTADTKIILGEKHAWRVVVPSTSNAATRIPLEFTAKYFNPVGVTLGVGNVQAQAILNITYE